MEALQAESCGFTPSGICDILRSVSKSSRLRFLDLGGNQLGDDGAKAVSAVIRHGTPQLEEVRLPHAAIPDAGLTELFRATADHPGMKILDTSGSPVGAQALAAACHMIKSNATLKGLKIEAAAPDHASEIAAAVKINPSLVDLELLGPRSEGAFASALASIEAQLRANRRYAGAAGRDSDVGNSPEKPGATPGAAGRRLIHESPLTKPRPYASPSLAAYSGLSKSASMVSRSESLRPELRSNVREREKERDDQCACVAAFAWVSVH